MSFEGTDDSVFTFQRTDDSIILQLSAPCTTSDSATDNKLVDSLGGNFFSEGAIPKSEISLKLEVIKCAFEDSAGCDEELIQAIVYSNYALVSFLLHVVVLGTSEETDTASRCLAFAGDIHSSLWVDYCAVPARLLLVLQVCKAATLRIAQLAASLPAKAGPNEHGGYLGFDERDVQDYDVEGYQAEDRTQREERAQQIQEATMVWLLLLFQTFSQPLPGVTKKVVSCRTRKNTAGRYSSRRMAKMKEGAGAELVAEVFGCDALDNLDLVAYFTELAGALLEFLTRRCLAEEAHNQCVKILALLNAQMPRLQQSDTNEIATLFAATDSGESGENLSQAVLHLLNENGYPHIHSSDTLAVIRLCKDVLHVEPQAAEEEEGADDGEGSPVPARSHAGAADSARGHFYTNDVKVMVDIVVRELCNIPHNTTGLTAQSLELASPSSSGKGTGTAGRARSSTADQIAAVLHGRVRFAYLELLDAIVSKSTWTSLGDCYMKDALKGLLDEVVARREDERSSAFAQGLLEKYSYYFT